MSLRLLSISSHVTSRPCILSTSKAITRYARSNSSTDAPKTQQKETSSSSPQSQPEQPKKRKTQAELDEELRQKMAGMAGDGGEAGIEFEDGQPVSMKRSVKNNMFRYI